MPQLPSSEKSADLYRSACWGRVWLIFALSGNKYQGQMFSVKARQASQPIAGQTIIGEKRRNQGPKARLKPRVEKSEMADLGNPNQARVEPQMMPLSPG
jgi:hypothetical protein